MNKDLNVVQDYWGPTFVPIFLLPGMGWRNWLGRFSFRFYDFKNEKDANDITECETELARIQCQKIGLKYKNDYIKKMRFCVICKFDTDVHGFVFGHDIYEKDLYVSLSCANPLSSDLYLKTKLRKEGWSERKIELLLNAKLMIKGSNKLLEAEFPDVDRKKYKTTVATGMGTILRSILIHYCFVHGYENIYNDAADADLVPYYARFGFRLGQERCNTDDEITAWHEAHLDALESEIQRTAVKTSAGYRMKLCNKFDQALIAYHNKQILVVEELLKKYPDLEGGEM